MTQKKRGSKPNCRKPVNGQKALNLARGERVSPATVLTTGLDQNAVPLPHPGQCFTVLEMHSMEGSQEGSQDALTGPTAKNQWLCLSPQACSVKTNMLSKMREVGILEKCVVLPFPPQQ